MTYDKNLTVLDSTINFLLHDSTSLTHAEKNGLLKMCHTLILNIKDKIDEDEQAEREKKDATSVLYKLLGTLPEDFKNDAVDDAHKLIDGLTFPF